ncbi:MAG: site-specific DNA-methyltransferase [Alphaproteobacteria bacterium]|nr:site-specific DNA-methyltransferase [Alphaproteobacteria bacterium]
MPTLDFKGKQYVHSHHLTVPFRALEVDAKKSLSDTPSLDDNLIIHGDNLHALKALMPKYAGKVKCIYIDPPYNTGNEGWCYNDNVNSPQIQEWLKKSANPVDKEDMQRHDKWLCMMWPRLQLLRELLAEDGVIFVSIDENEQHRLRCIMDEIFGENCFLADFIRKTRTGSNDAANFVSIDHEYVVAYFKGAISLQGIEKDFANYTNPDNDPRGDWTRGDLTCNKTAEERPNLFYEIIDPKTNITFPCSSTRVWAYERNRMQQLVDEGKILFPNDGNGNPMYKRYKSEVRSSRKPFGSLLETKMNFMATKDLREIFEGQRFDYPKPYDLVKQLVQQTTDKDSIILDSFAGSGTTAHAVLDLNKEDGGNRKFILVEMEDYASDVTAERVRRVINGVPNAKDDKLKAGLGGSFTFANLGEAFDIDKILTGESLPEYNALAQYVFYTATGESLDTQVKPRADFFVGESALFEVYLIYQPDLAFLRSNDSALNQDKLDVILAKKSTKKKLIFATAKYMSQTALGKQIDFCQIPYAIHKIAGN